MKSTRKDLSLRRFRHILDRGNSTNSRLELSESPVTDKGQTSFHDRK